MPDLPCTVHHRVRPGYKMRQITERKSSGAGLLLKIVSSPISGKGSLLQNKLQNGLHSFFHNHCNNLLLLPDKFSYTLIFITTIFWFFVCNIEKRQRSWWRMGFQSKSLFTWTFILIYLSWVLGKTVFQTANSVAGRECVKGQTFSFRTLFLCKDHSMKLMMNNNKQRVFSNLNFQTDLHCKPNLEIDSKLCYTEPLVHAWTSAPQAVGHIAIDLKDIGEYEITFFFLQPVSKASLVTPLNIFFLQVNGFLGKSSATSGCFWTFFCAVLPFTTSVWSAEIDTSPWRHL